MQIFSMILSLLCGVALFLFGMSLMGDGLKMVAGNKLEAFLYRMTNTPIKGVALGTAVTSVIQSSSATTVMVIGFVNSGSQYWYQYHRMDLVSVLYSGFRRDRKHFFNSDDICRCSSGRYYFPHVWETLRT